MAADLPPSWRDVLGGAIDKASYRSLQAFVAVERRLHTVFPAEEEVFAALAVTPYEQVKVLLLGQDPYHDYGQAHGLCFSVRPGVKPPPSLMNIFKELRDDMGFPLPRGGCLIPWAEQGVLLLNAVLTVRAHEANSHQGKGWEEFTDAIIGAVSARREPVVFVLWGGYARRKLRFIDTDRHPVIQAAHPSPLSARRGFFGSRPFSRINKLLRENGKPEIQWQLPDDPYPGPDASRWAWRVVSGSL